MNLSYNICFHILVKLVKVGYLECAKIKWNIYIQTVGVLKVTSYFLFQGVGSVVIKFRLFKLMVFIKFRLFKIKSKWKPVLCSDPNWGGGLSSPSVSCTNIFLAFAIEINMICFIS